MPENCHILVIEDKKYRRTVSLEKESYSIGRYQGNSIFINSDKISRKHATLILKKNSRTNQYCYWILDGDLEGNKSFNGIFVNGEKCLARELKHGDLINFGCEVNASYHTTNNWSDTIMDLERLNSIQQKPTLILPDASEENLSHKNTFEAHVYHDSLTNLPNQKLFLEYLSIALTNAKQNQHLMAILLLDLDGFSKINERIGYPLGDQLLKDFAKRLNNCFRAGDIVARWGGDEFIILLPQIRNAEDLGIVCQRIFNALEQPFEIKQQSVALSIHLGIALSPQDGEESQTLLKKAESDLSHNQQQRRNPYLLNKSHQQVETSQLSKIESLLRQALKNEEFSLYYQPQINIQTGKIYGMEALLRWQHPKKGLISPSKFIPIAEKTDLIIPINQWVLRAACQQNQAWQAFGLPALPVAINLSPRQFYDPHLGKRLAKVLQETGLDPHWLELEITENAILENVELAQRICQELQQIGVHLSLDDFGIGYSSLTYLPKLPFHTLKIAQSLVKQLTDCPQDTALISAVIALGRSLNFRVVAKGVETQAQLGLLRKLQCQEIQGYRLSQPLKEEDATAFLRRLTSKQYA